MVKMVVVRRGKSVGFSKKVTFQISVVAKASLFEEKTCFRSALRKDEYYKSIETSCSGSGHV